MPLRSSGCYLCRKRKIRCDETRPRCKRCATHGVPCPGYRSEQKDGIEFRHQTSITVKRAQDHYRGTKAGGSSSSDSDVEDTASSHFALTTKSRPSLADGAAACPGLTIGDVAIIGEELLSRALVWPAEPPQRVYSPAANRSQLYGAFLDLYLPKKTHVKVDAFSFFTTIANLPSEEPALRQALDAMSLITVGSRVKERSIIEQALKSYGRALGSLAQAIARKDPVDSDELLAAVEVLGACALYDEIGRHKGAWGSHVNGSQQLIAARGPESIQSGISHLLFSSAKHSALVWALIERKAPVLATPEWRAVASRSLIQDSSVTFYDAALQVPGLLEQHDTLLDTFAPTVGAIDKALVECERLEIQLRIWYADWRFRCQVDTSNELFEETPIDDFHDFTKVCSDRTFETAYMFPSFPMSYLASLYWLCMHFLRTTIQSLHRLRHDLDPSWWPKSSSIVPESEILGYVVHLCKTIPFFCEPVTSNAGHVGIFLPMRTAAIYFTQHNHWREAKWVGAVRMSVFTKGLSPPQVRQAPSTISKMHKLPPPAKGRENWQMAFWQCDNAAQVVGDAVPSSQNPINQAWVSGNRGAVDGKPECWVRELDDPSLAPTSVLNAGRAFWDTGAEWQSVPESQYDG